MFSPKMSKTIKSQSAQFFMFIHEAELNRYYQSIIIYV